jgi:hypothetical protein
MPGPPHAKGDAVVTRLFPRFSAAEFARRHAAVRALMAEHGRDALVAYGNSGISRHNHVPNAREASGIPTEWGGADRARRVGRRGDLHALLRVNQRGSDDPSRDPE